MSDQPKRVRLITNPADLARWEGDSDAAFRLGLLEVGGADITRATRSVDIHVDAVDIPQVTVGLVVIEAEFDGRATIRLPDETRAALIALGWTPPAG